MQYSFEELSLEALVDLIDNRKVDLNPSYQRNFIWTSRDQNDLVDTILHGWPLPNFFMYKKPNGLFEMVDGQQRSKTIYRFAKGVITSSKETGAVSYDAKRNELSSYRLPFVMLKDVSDEETLRKFYVLINKKGKHLNPAEVQRSEFHSTNFMKLANEMVTYQKFIDLNIFSEASSKRLNDREFVQELLGFLKSGIKDKKKHIASIFEADIDNEEYFELKKSFQSIIDILHKFNDYMPLKSTRYKQKNDFYTLFSFVSENQEEKEGVLLFQYRILLALDGVDNSGKQIIRPTNESCVPLKRYAENCVTQSNSKAARDARLKFYNEMLKNTGLPPNDVMLEVLQYFAGEFGEERVDTVEINGFNLLDVDMLKAD